MKINLTELIKESRARELEAAVELSELAALGTLIKALSDVQDNPQIVAENQEEYEKIVSYVHKICAKHEIRLPEYIEWSSIELV